MVINNLNNLQSVQAGHKARRTSGKYSFIPTTQVLKVLDSNGWNVSQASEIKVRNEERRGFQKHLIRLRHRDTIKINTMYRENLVPEIVLTNSHDGLASFNLMMGVFRMVCSNGMIVADSLLASHKIRHKGYADELVKEAVYNIVDNTPKVMNRIQEFSQIEMNDSERMVYGESAMDVLYNKDKWNEWNREQSVVNLIKPKRIEDAPSNLWTTFNTVQEKFLKGNRYMQKKNERYYRPTKSREVKSIDKNVKLNKALWTLTEKMAELKNG